MKRKITFLIAALFALMLITQPKSVWGQTRATATLTNAEIVDAGQPASGYNSYAITGGGGKTWNVYAIKNYHSKATNDKYYLQIRAKQNSTYYYVQVPEYGTKITSITMTVSGSSQPMDGGGNSATLFFSNSNQTSATGAGVASGTGASSVTIDCSSLNLNTGYITAGGAVRIWDVEVTYNTSAPTTVETPVITLEAGIYTGNQSTTITCGTVDASIYYTLDGTTPSSSNGTLYEGAITIDHSCTLKAIGIKDGLTDSEVAEAAYTIKMATPTFSPAEGTYDATQSVTLSSTAGATIYYTLDGTEPSTSSSVYSSALSITSTKTIKAYAVKASCTDSDVATATYTLKAQTPTFSPAAGEYVGTQSVSINCATSDVTIYYTTDGSTPTTGSTEYDGAILVSSSQTLKAIAVKANLENSDVASAAYTIHQPLTTMDEIFAAAVAGEGEVVNRYVTFNDWVVTGVNGNYAFVTDGTKGFMIYKSSHGFVVGNKLNGTTTSTVSIKLWGGAAEFTTLTKNTGGLTVTTGGTVSPQVVTIDELSGVNTGAVITLNGVTYNGTNLVDASDNTINPYTTLYPGSYSNGQKYNITGVYQQQTNAPHRILPRKAADIVAVYDPNVAVSPTGTVAIPNYIKGTPVANITTRNITVSGTNLTNDITVALKDGASSKFEIYDATNTTWTYTLTLSPTTGTVSATAIPVRLKASHNTGDYSDNINITSIGATAKSVSLTGSVKYAHVTYNGNGTEANVPEDDNDYTYNQEVTVLGSGSMARTGYTFDSWNTEEEGTGTERNEDDVFNITEDVTLYAQWTVNTHTLTLPATDAYGEYTADKSSPVAYGTKVTLTYAPEDGYEDYIAQWSSSDVVIASDGTFTMPDKDVTVTVTVIPNPYTKDVLDLAFTGVTSTSYTAWSGKTGESGAVYAGKTTTNGNNDYLQMNNGDGDRGIVTTTSGGKIKQLTVSWYSDPINNRSITVYGKNTAYTATSDLYDNDKKGSSLGTLTKTNKTLIVSGDYAYIGLYASGAIYIDEIDIFWEYVLPVDEGTLVDDAIIPSNAIVNETNLIVPNDKLLYIEGVLHVSGTLTNQGTEDNIYIADGGQLYANSVIATVQKTITSASSKDADQHWYTIATPVHKGSYDYVEIGETNLTSGEYDMFYLDETKGQWINQKTVGGGTGFDNMDVARGYLYRSNVTSLEIAGNTNTGDAITYTLTKTGDGAISGFNLIGNPYPHDINLKHITYSKGENLNGCYILSDAGAWSSELAADATISPYQGFLVQADVNDKVATFHETAQRGAKSNGDNIKFIVANSEYSDATYALFDDCFGLNKINHRNSDIPMLYINQNNEDFAIAPMSDDTKSFNLNFKAKTTGRYTLSYKAKGEFNYLHIIDRITGEDVDMLLEGEYSFIASPNDSDKRFIVRLGYNAGNETSDDIFAYQSGNDIVVNGEGELQVFDVTGRMVKIQRINGVQTINLNTQGVYIFRLNEKTQKIVVE